MSEAPFRVVLHCASPPTFFGVCSANLHVNVLVTRLPDRRIFLCGAVTLLRVYVTVIVQVHLRGSGNCTRHFHVVPWQ